MRYYRVARELLAAAGELYSVLDVGSHTCPLVAAIPAQVRLAVDLSVWPDLPGVVGIRGDWMRLDVGPVDGVFCLQVLEHVADPAAFGARLWAATRRVLVVSVPYGWPAGSEPAHRRDHVGVQDLAGWIGLAPDEYEIVEDNSLRRLVAAWYRSRPVEGSPNPGGTASP